MRIKCYILFSLLAIFLPLLACLFTSRPASALSNINIENFDIIYTSEDSPYCRYQTKVQTANGYNYPWSSYGFDWSPWSGDNDVRGVEGFTCKKATTGNLETVTGDFLVYTIKVKDYRSENMTDARWNQFYGQFVGTKYYSGEADTVYVQEVGEIVDNGFRTITFELVARSNGDWNPDIGFVYNWGSGSGNLKVIQVQQLRLRSDASVDYSSSLSAIVSAINSEKNTLGGKLDTLHSDNTSIISAINDMSIDIQNSTDDASDQAHEDYEDSKQREEDKQDELEDQSGDVSISASAIANPFASLFGSPNCATLPTLASWLHTDADKIKVCSPYPQQFRPIIEFVSSAIVVGLLIRVYYKQLKGGYAS